jgi:methylglutaconyl-CoA hydratase
MTNPISGPVVEGIDSDATSSLVRIVVTPAGVATISMNRPQARNAFNAELIAALHEAFETMRTAEHVRVVFLRGEGGFFSAGADLEWMKTAANWSEAENRDDAMHLATMLKSLRDIPALTVALIEGGGFGGGAGLAAACDMAIATSGCKFSFSEVKLGLIAATISPYVIQAIGPRNARGLFATGRIFDAAHALSIGLVTEVVTNAKDLSVAADRVAQELMACAPGAVGDSKRLVDDIAFREIDHRLLEETARRIASARVSVEGQEGVRAFLEKRQASWTQ